MAQFPIDPKLIRKAWRSFLIRWVLWFAVLGGLSLGGFQLAYYFLGRQPQILVYLQSLFNVFAWFIASYWAFQEALKEYAVPTDAPPQA